MRATVVRAVLILAAALGVPAFFGGCSNPATASGAGPSVSTNGVLVPTTAPSVLTAGTGTVTVDPTLVRQTIEGFGASNAWTSLPSDATAKATVVKLLFSTTEGAGLTLIRNRIPFREDTGNTSHTGYNDSFLSKSSAGTYTSTTTAGHRFFTLNWSNWDLKNTRTLFSLASVYSAEIKGFSTPWTPPNNHYDSWKIDEGTNTVGGTYGDETEFPSIGGVLDPAHYQDYADVLADYASQFQANMGYPLAAISIQNEPNWLPKTYESCGWSAAQFKAFLPFLGSAWAAKGVTTPVIAPESYSFTEDLISPSLASSALAGLVSIVGVHQYSGSAAWLSATKTAGKRLWETEVSSGSTNDSSITDGLAWAQKIHSNLTVAEVNAFCYWWLWNTSSSPTKSALLSITGTTVTDNKRLYTLGQYSRFVRPGWVRLLAETDPKTNVLTSVFRNPNAQAFAAVLINTGSTAQTITLKPASGLTFGTSSVWRTSASESLASVGTLAAGATQTVTLPAQSVTTVTGSW